MKYRVLTDTSPLVANKAAITNQKFPLISSNTNKRSTYIYAQIKHFFAILDNFFTKVDFIASNFKATMHQLQIVAEQNVLATS